MQSVSLRSTAGRCAAARAFGPALVSRFFSPCSSFYRLINFNDVGNITKNHAM
jgi:hypothetical protein